MHKDARAVHVNRPPFILEGGSIFIGLNKVIIILRAQRLYLL